MSECLQIKTPGACTDTTLRKLGEYRFDIVPRGNNSEFTKITLVCSDNPNQGIVRVLNGSLFSDKTSGAIDSITLTSGTNVFYIKSNGAKGELILENAEAVLNLGNGTTSASQLAYPENATNSPLLYLKTEHLACLINLDTAYIQGCIRTEIESLNALKKLRQIYCSYTYTILGSISNLKLPNLRYIDCHGSSPVVGDLSKFAKNCPLLNGFAFTLNPGITYAGDGSRLSETVMRNLTFNVALSNTTSSRNFGNLIKALSLCVFENQNMIVVLRGDINALNSEEIAALNTLKAKATVTINN